MGWLRIDDGFISNRKIAALTDGELRLWIRVLCFAAAHRRQRMGRFSRQDRREIPGFSDAKSARFQALGLLDETDELGIVIVHDWEHYNPTDKTAAERKRRERDRRGNPADLPDVTSDSHRDTARDDNSDNSRDPRARARSRTQQQEPKELRTTTTSDSETETPNDEPDEHAAAPATPNPPEAPRTTDIADACRRHSADPTQVETLAQAMTAEDFNAVTDTVAERCASGQVRNPAGLLIQLLRERLTETHRQQSKVFVPTLQQQIEAEAAQIARTGAPLEVAIDLTTHKLRRLQITETDWPPLIELATSSYAATLTEEPSLA